MNIEALEFPDENFDGITSVETLEHLLTPEKAIGELARVLRPGGRLVVTYPTINRTIAKRLRLGKNVAVSEHLNEWSYRELAAAMESAGLRVERVEGIAFDFGVLLGLKYINRFFAAGLTRASLAIRGFPRNSMFVAMRMRKPPSPG
jgi:SAM-dependent methyltransferase